MKKIISLILLAIVGVFVGCSTDNDSNPTYRQPDSFVLNTPGMATAVYDLETSSVMKLTCSQPDYSFTAATTYVVQVSLNDTWIDETESDAATYEELETSFTKAEINVNALELDKAIVKLSAWKSEADFDSKEKDIYVRLKASIISSMASVFSNSIKLNVQPYYVELKDASPSFFFLIGNYVGGWNTGMKDIGTSMIPMSLVKDYKYDKKTGAGKFTYTNYFDEATSENGFKLIGMIKGVIDWNEQWGNGGSSLPGNTGLEHLHNEGGDPGHLGVSEAGWYRIDVNDNEEQKLTFTKLTGEPYAAYSSVQLLGDFGDASPIEMRRIGSTTHSWTATVTFSTIGEAKFRANNNDNINWGNSEFPFGLGTQNGSSIIVQPGIYIVTFNDIEGSYCFFIQK